MCYHGVIFDISDARDVMEGLLLNIAIVNDYDCDCVFRLIAALSILCSPIYFRSLAYHLFTSLSSSSPAHVAQKVIGRNIALSLVQCRQDR